MSAEKMTDEKRKILGQLRMTEALYVLMSEFHKNAVCGVQRRKLR